MTTTTANTINQSEARAGSGGELSTNERRGEAGAPDLTLPSLPGGSLTPGLVFVTTTSPGPGLGNGTTGWWAHS